MQLFTFMALHLNCALRSFNIFQAVQSRTWARLPNTIMHFINLNSYNIGEYETLEIDIDDAYKSQHVQLF